MAASFAQTLYVSKAWVDLRFRLIMERGPVCQQCGKIMADSSQLVGHHRKPLTPANINDVMVTLNPNNILIICRDCHEREHRRFGYHRQSVYVVYGSPCSGKVATVNQLATRGDLILDIDKLFACISGLPVHDKPDNLRFNVFALRDKMIDMIKTRYGKWNDAWVIGGYPNKTDRERLAEDLGAELIYCGSTKAECLARAAALQGDWAKWVEKGWSEYEQ